MKHSMINPDLPTMTEDAEDPDAAGSALLTNCLSGRTLSRFDCCSGEGTHPAHITLLFVGGTKVSIVAHEGSFMVGMVEGDMSPADVISTEIH